MSARFCGTGSCVPDYVMDNDGVAELVETSDSWIRERTGIARRHIAVKETTVSMANEAAKRALDNAGVLPEELDLILMSTISSDVIIPCGACEVQKAIGADKAVCFDLNGACTGFVLAYNTALAYIESGIYQTVLIVGSESLSRLTNWKDRGTCILFGKMKEPVIFRRHILTGLEERRFCVTVSERRMDFLFRKMMRLAGNI